MKKETKKQTHPKLRLTKSDLRVLTATELENACGARRQITRISVEATCE